MSGDFVEVAHRAHTLAAAAGRQSARRQPPGRNLRPDPARRPQAVLVFDCETTTGPEQALLFGVTATTGSAGGRRGRGWSA
jgi:hypothetical protein